MNFIRNRKSSASQEVEINVVPIVDCLTILVIFLLASGVFLSIGVLDVGVSSAGKVLKRLPPPDVSLSVELMKNKDIRWVIEGKASDASEKLITQRKGSWDSNALVKELEKARGAWPGVTEVTLKSDLEVPYREVVEVMGWVKKSHKDVLIGGF